MAAASPGPAASSDADVFAFIPPVPVSSHRFKRLGSLRFTANPYHASPLADTLYRADSLLAVSNRYARVFVVAPTTPPSLLVASTAALVAAVSSAAAQADQYDDGASKEASVAATAFLGSVPLADDGVWHLSLSNDEQWLLCIADERGSLYHISQFAQLHPTGQLDPLVTFDHPDVIVNVQWSPHHASLLYLLGSDGQLSVQQVAEAGVEEVGLFNNKKVAITAFLLSSYAPDELIYLAHADGSLDVSTLDIDAHKLSQHGYAVRDEDDDDSSKDMQMRFQRRYKGRNPCPRDFNHQPALHHISQPAPHTLLLGYALSRGGDAQSMGWLVDGDVVRVAVCCFDLESAEEEYWSDVLEDELRLSADDKPYAARHRYGLLPLPALSTALLWSNRAAETAIVGPDPTADNSSRWVPYEVPTEADKAVVPFDADFNDTFALGMCFDFTNSVRVAVDEKEDAVMPLLIMLTSDASLHLYHFICSQPSAAEASNRVMLTSVAAMPTVASDLNGSTSPITSPVPLANNTAKGPPPPLFISTPIATASVPIDSNVPSPAAHSVSSKAGSAYSSHSTDTTAAVTPLSSSTAPPASSASAIMPIVVLAPSSPTTASHSSPPALINASLPSASSTTVSPVVAVTTAAPSVSPDAVTFHFVSPLLVAAQPALPATDVPATPAPLLVCAASLNTAPSIDTSIAVSSALSPSPALHEASDPAPLPSEAIEQPLAEQPDVTLVAVVAPSLPVALQPAAFEFPPSVSALAEHLADTSPDSADGAESYEADAPSEPSPRDVSVPARLSTSRATRSVSMNSSTRLSTDEQDELSDEPSEKMVEVPDTNDTDFHAPTDKPETALPPAVLPELDVQSVQTEVTPVLQPSVSQLTAQFVSLTSELLQRQEQLAASRDQLRVLEQSTLALHSHHPLLHSLNSQIASLTQQLSEQQGRADSLDARMDQQSVHVDEVYTALESSERQRMALQAAARADAASHADTVRQLQAELAAARAAAASRADTSSHNDSIVAQLQSELLSYRAELAQTHQLLATSIPLVQHQHALSSSNSQLSTTQTSLSTAQSDMAALRQQLTDATSANKPPAPMNGFPFDSREFRSALEAFAAHEHNLNTLRQQLLASHPLASNPLANTATTQPAAQPQHPSAAQLSLQQADQVTRHLLLSSHLAIVGQECLGSLERVRREVEALVRHEEGRSQRLRHAQKSLTKGRPLDASSYSVSDQCSIS